VNIYGIVPDGVTAVTVTPAGAAGPTSVPVTPGGTYTLPFQSASISVDGPAGQTDFTVLG
jgi:hypothetical protein